MRSPEGWNCKRCLHTPSGACGRHAISGDKLSFTEPPWVEQMRRTKEIIDVTQQKARSKT